MLYLLDLSIDQKYVFYLGFENSLCIDSITESSFIITPGTWLMLFAGVLTTIGCYQTSLTQYIFRLQQSYQNIFRTWPPQKNYIPDTSATRTDTWLIGGPLMLRHFATAVESYITLNPTGSRTTIM